MAQTDTSAMSWDQAAYDRLIDKPLRADLIFNDLVTKKPTRQSMPGSSVVLNIKNELAAATTPLTEGTDVTPVAMSDTPVTVTLNEYGNATETTAKLRGTSYVEVDPEAAETIGFNAALSLNALALAPLSAFSTAAQVIYGGAATSRVTVAAGHIIARQDLSKARAKLIGANVHGFYGGAGIGTSYVAVMHPDVEYDLRNATAAGSWRAPKEYVDTQDLYNGETGWFENFRIIVNSLANKRVDAGVGAVVDVYDTLFMGNGALAKAFSTTDGNGDMPQAVIGPQTDRLRRFHPIGWYWLGGFAIYRGAAVVRLESSSSIGVNT